MIEPKPEIRDEIREFVNENWSFFARWDNGDISIDQIDWVDDRGLDDQVLVNDRLPGAIATKGAFLEFFPQMHGRFADDPVTPRIELLVVGELAPNVYVVTYRQDYDFVSGETTSRVITEILVRKHDQLRVQHIHE